MVIWAFSKAQRQGKLPSSLSFLTHPFERHTFPNAAVSGFTHTLIWGAGGTSFLITFWQLLSVSVVRLFYYLCCSFYEEWVQRGSNAKLLLHSRLPW